MVLAYLNLVLNVDASEITYINISMYSNFNFSGLNRRFNFFDAFGSSGLKLHKFDYPILYIFNVYITCRPDIMKYAQYYYYLI